MQSSVALLQVGSHNDRGTLMSRRDGAGTFFLANQTYTISGEAA